MLSGKPLIAWSIEQALASRYIDRVVVSTESKEIAAAAKKYGGEVPFIRPAKLATSSSKITDVVIHALDFMKGKGSVYDLVMLLQPTSPLRRSKDIDAAIRLFFRKKANAIISVCFEEHPPRWSNILNKNGEMRNFVKSTGIEKRRQELPEYYRMTGAIYLIYTSSLRKNKKFLVNRTYAYKMPAERSVDIDKELDLNFAQFLNSRKVY